MNAWIAKWFGKYINLNQYNVKEGGYKHLPLYKKAELIRQVDFKQISVCEDETKAYYYWKNNFNPNKNDCCNLRIKED